jgi:uncharacterized protein (DUF1015 family)
MAEIYPFCGIRYNQNKVGNLSKVVAPPYDVISPAEKEKLLRSHPYNCIRLILGKSYSENGPEDEEKYRRAARYFHQWLKEGILTKDPQPAIYIYDQIYTLKNNHEVKRLRGFISLVRLVDYEKGVILPHETTFYKPTADRLSLLRATQANFSCIYALYADPHDVINQILEEQTRTTPLVSHLTTGDGIKHYLWKIDNSKIIKKIQQEMRDKQIIIGDGHHRYKTALLYRDERKKTEKFNPNVLYNHTLMFLVNMHDKGVSILPTHRIIHNLKGLDFNKLEENIKEYFEVEEFPFEGEEDEMPQRRKMFERLEICGRTDHAFGMFCQGQKKYYLLVLRDGAEFEKMVNINMSRDWKRLDATVLHVLFIDHILHISRKDVKNLINISYLKDEEEGIQLVKNGSHQIALFMNPTKIRQVEIIVQNREKMPQKSTYFYPKLLSGLVMNEVKGEIES